ncbi:argininosuccinate synthase domain-containing protein [Rhizobium phaseoli]|nr:argininosuccinate synthase domain-containing protein [Rhizobium phaseoli]MDH6650749.1 argininosuccinate synthase [Rhizobium esperanzae]
MAGGTSLIGRSQAFVSGEVIAQALQRKRLGHIAGPPSSLYSADLVNFNEGRVAYNHRDADDFIRLNGLRLTTGQPQWKMTRLTL